MDVIPTIFVFTELSRCRLLAFKFDQLIVSSMELNPFSATHQGQTNLMVFLSGACSGCGRGIKEKGMREFSYP
jgi:hypothetical protein